jgi:hypothetical protein
MGAVALPCGQATEQRARSVASAPASPALSTPPGAGDRDSEQGRAASAPAAKFLRIQMKLSANEAPRKNARAL